ncbi:MAG: hypothetical protein NTX09_17965, partial [Verrucomicrobia bacterium]|nr:hypothetical protein [Verrucomicrobiota bacterium]
RPAQRAATRARERRRWSRGPGRAWRPERTAGTASDRETVNIPVESPGAFSENINIRARANVLANLSPNVASTLAPALSDQPRVIVL